MFPVSILEKNLRTSPREDFWFIVTARSEDEAEIRAGKAPAEQVLKDIRRQTRRQYSAEEKIHLASCWKGLRAVRRTSPRAVPPGRHRSRTSMYYGWSKEFLEAGKRRLAGDTARAATPGEVKRIFVAEATALKEVVADPDPGEPPA